eukprot:scaffold8721_cov80-Phaeocystis_antarctica.AAC.40
MYRLTFAVFQAPPPPLKPIGGGSAFRTLARSEMGARPLASGSISAHASLKFAMSLLEIRFGLTLPSVVKFSRMTATTRLSITNEPSTWKETKYGMAAAVPQLPSSTVQLELSGDAMQSDMIAAQSSPVSTWKRSSRALPKLLKLRSSVRSASPWATYLQGGCDGV